MDGFDWKNSKSGLEYKNQTFEARGFYNHFNGFRYLSLYDSQGKWVGYINELGTVVGYGTQGPHQDYGRYVSIKGNYDIWDGFDWKKNTLSTMYKNQTFEARGFYNHFNGSRYLSLYDNEGKWLGYINELGTMLGNGAQGAHQKYDKYVSINGNYNIWNSFDWKTSQLGSKYKNQMFHARGVYNHFNNSRYLSLYDNQGKWLGYINENGTILENGAQGPSTDYRKYVSIKGSYDIWTSFNWGKKHPGLEYKNQTFEARTVYNHFNGSRYLSLYDNKGIWLGYINEIGIIQSDGEQGVYQNYGKYVNIEGNYNIWNGFNWKKNQSGIKYKNQKIEARGIYHHFNGSRYLSLYNNKGKWLGYMNANGVNYTYKYWTKKKNTWYYFDDDGLEIDNHQTNFISKNILDVLRITDKYDLYPSIMLGQAILESGYGTSELAKNANNFFGMKFKENEDEGKYDTYFVETKEYDSEKNEMVTILAPFRKYRNKLHSFEDNALKLRQGVSWDNNYYAGAWRENTKNYKEVSAALTGKYATDPQYYQKLNSIIERWELHQFD